MASMEETEREELFERMNKYERSRIINLAEKHCAQMMDLIHRYNLPILLGTEKTWLLAAVQYLDGMAIILLDPLLDPLLFINFYLQLYDPKTKTLQ